MAFTVARSSTSTLRTPAAVLESGTPIIASSPARSRVSPQVSPNALTCLWYAAASTPLNHALLRNGVGMYRYTARDLEAFCVFIWTADPGVEPDPRVRDTCARGLAQAESKSPAADSGDAPS